MQWVQTGTIAHLACCTSGDASGDDARADPLGLAAEREQGQRVAASMVGYEGVTFLHRPDGAVVNDLALREQLVRLVRTFRPDTLAVPDPTVLFPRVGGIGHIDRREAGLAGIDAIDPAGRPMAFPHLLTAEGLVPHRVGQLLVYWPAEPGTVVDISQRVERKIDALREHGPSTATVDPTEVFSIVDLV